MNSCDIDMSDSPSEEEPYLSPQDLLPDSIILLDQLISGFGHDPDYYHALYDDTLIHILCLSDTVVSFPEIQEGQPCLRLYKVHSPPYDAAYLPITPMQQAEMKIEQGDEIIIKTSLHQVVFSGMLGVDIVFEEGEIYPSNLKK